MAKGISKELARGILELEPSAVLEFYQIYFDWENNPNDFLAIHAGTNGVDGPIIWQKMRYLPYNIEGSAWEIKNDQTLPRPKLKISNHKMVASTLLRKFDNLNNAKIIRKRTLAKFIDDENFEDNQNPYGSENFTAGFPDEKYYVSRKITENREYIELELVTPLELENVKIPNRKVHSLRCAWIYRGHGCRYNGPPIAEQTDDLLLENPVTQQYKTHFYLNGQNDFTDISYSQRGSFSGYLASPTGQGLLKQGGGDANYPSISTAQTVSGLGSSIYFNGSGAIILNGPLDGAEFDDFTHERGESEINKTVSFWAYPYSGVDYAPNNIGYVLDMGDNHGGFGVYYDTGNMSWVAAVNLKIDDASSTVYCLKENSLEFNKWAHITFSYNLVYSNLKPRLYVNAELIASGDTSAVSRADKLLTYSTGANAIGVAVDGVAPYIVPYAGADWNLAYRGWLDDIRFYKSVLNEQEIEALYQGKRSNVPNINEVTDMGKWQSTGTYNKGDYVYIEGQRYKMFAPNAEKGFQGIKFSFICTQDNTTTDPRKDSSRWSKDSCGKSVHSCSLRFGNALPFGGFPGTHRYPFSS